MRVDSLRLTGSSRAYSEDRYYPSSTHPVGIPAAETLIYEWSRVGVDLRSGEWQDEAITAMARLTRTGNGGRADSRKGICPEAAIDTSRKFVSSSQQDRSGGLSEGHKHSVRPEQAMLSQLSRDAPAITHACARCSMYGRPESSSYVWESISYVDLSRSCVKDAARASTCNQGCLR